MGRETAHVCVDIGVAAATKRAQAVHLHRAVGAVHALTVLLAQEFATAVCEDGGVPRVRTVACHLRATRAMATACALMDPLAQAFVSATALRLWVSLVAQCALNVWMGTTVFRAACLAKTAVDVGCVGRA